MLFGYSTLVYFGGMRRPGFRVYSRGKLKLDHQTVYDSPSATTVMELLPPDKRPEVFSGKILQAIDDRFP